MYKKDLNTSSGMWALWDYDTYKDVDYNDVDFDKWESMFCEDEDIEKQIKRKSFVPISIDADGCCSFTVKIDEELNDREKKYLCIKSEKYLFHSNGKAVVSGIDYIDTSVNDDEAIIFELPEGDYSVEIHLISWDEEPGAFLDNGDISPDALSDFVVIIKSGADTKSSFRESIVTFEE